jgi:hypothetical protein
MERFLSWKAVGKTLGAAALMAATLSAATAQTVNLNCGGVAFTASDGTQWSADGYFKGGDLLYTGYSIANVQPQDFYLYRSARAGLYGDFSYSIPLANGTYTLSLLFAETQYTAKGDRVFNVAVNGSPVLSGFDILTHVAPLTPFSQQFTTTVTNGILQIDFTGVTRRALVSAIQVTPASGAGSTAPAGTPSLALSASTLNFVGTAGAPNPSPQSVTVSNAGTGTLTWTAASNQTWLTVSPGSGTDTGTLALTANVAGLGAGTYSATVTVSSGGASKTIAAALTVAAVAPPSPSSALALSKTLLSFSGTADGTNPPAQTVAIASIGGGTLNWAASSNQGWLSVSPASGTNSGTLTISANTGSLAAGAYSGAVTVNGGSSGSQTVNVSATVSAAAGGTVTLPSGSGNAWYVTTTGSSGGDGSASHPWDLATALSGRSRVKPGDTIWVRAGRYGAGQANSVVYSTLVGTASAPIIVRAYPGERVTIDEWLQVGCCDGAPNPGAGSYTWFWGLEFAGFNPNRATGSSGPPSYGAGANHNGADTWGAGTKFINCVVHDTGGGLSVWNAADAEMTGNIVYNVGGYGPDRGHGHLFYLQNQAPSVVTVNDNIGFNNFDMGIQAYGSGTGPYIQNMRFNGNAIFNSGVLYGRRADNITIGGGTGGPSGIVVKNNFFYNPPTATDGYNELGYLWTSRAGDVVATDNYFIGGYQAVDLERWQSVVFQNNTIYSQGNDESMWIMGSGQSTGNYQVSGNQYFGNGHFTLITGCDGWPCGGSQGMSFSAFQSATGLDRSSTYSAGAPTGVQTFVRPNAYETGRANIVIFNWSMQGSVQVDLSASGIKMGDNYQIRDAQNWYGGAVASGTYSGAPVTIPMTGLSLAQPVGSVPNPATHTAPLFGTFVLLSGSTLTNTY